MQLQKFSTKLFSNYRTKRHLKCKWKIQFQSFQGCFSVMQKFHLDLTMKNVRWGIFHKPLKGKNFSLITMICMNFFFSIISIENHRSCHWWKMEGKNLSNKAKRGRNSSHGVLEKNLISCFSLNFLFIKKLLNFFHVCSTCGCNICT